MGCVHKLKKTEAYTILYVQYKTISSVLNLSSTGDVVYEINQDQDIKFKVYADIQFPLDKISMFSFLLRLFAILYYS